MKKELVDLMTVQEAMDYAMQKLVEQGKRCTNENVCSYGDANGNHCGVGWLLDESNKNLMNFKFGVAAFAKHSSLRNEIPKLIIENLDAFIIFQRVHDKYEDGNISNLEQLERMGIDTSGENWRKWSEL